MKPEARGLHIVKVKADLEFLPLRELVNELPTSPDTEFAAQGMHVGPVNGTFGMARRRLDRFDTLSHLTRSRKSC